MTQDRYKEAGVDIAAGQRLVDRIAPMAAATGRPEVLGGLGGFGSLWSIPAGRYQDLVLVSGADGVGTKLIVAHLAGRHDTVGIDLVAMCVNDVVCAGAEPFYFLDYFATGKLDEGVAAAVIAGVAEGCKQAGCALAGGETAEMPGVYGPGVYDLAGFCVGGVERADMLAPDSVVDGMVAIGLASTGFHSNGFSLVRRVVFEEQALELNDPFPRDADGRTVAEVLLTPTRIYVKTVLELMKQCTVGGASHITGGGLTENLPRVIADSLSVEIDLGSWELPNAFARLQQWGGLTDSELRRTFNCGVGMVVLVAPEDEEKALAIAAAHGEQAWRIGQVIPRAAGSTGFEVVG